jgi:hypothetical protein
MKPLLILEGPDCGGKTTLAETLEREHGYRRVHMGPPGPQHPYEQYMEALADAAIRQKQGIDTRPVVFDRLHLGERVYGPQLRGEDKLGAALTRQLDRVIMGLNGAIVYCRTDTETTLEIWRDRNAKGLELVKNEGQMRAIIDRYDAIMAEQASTKLRHDWQTQWTAGALLEVSQREQRNVGPGIGHWTEGVTLLIGERINREFRGSIDWPFTGIGASSLWLTEQLISWGVSENDLYWVNAKSPLGDDLDPSFIEKLRPKKIIALGNLAEGWCRFVAKCQFSTVEHPQFWKRFRHKEPYPLKELLTNG